MCVWVVGVEEGSELGGGSVRQVGSLPLGIEGAPSFDSPPSRQGIKEYQRSKGKWAGPGLAHHGGPIYPNPPRQTSERTSFGSEEPYGLNDG